MPVAARLDFLCDHHVELLELRALAHLLLLALRWRATDPETRERGAAYSARTSRLPRSLVLSLELHPGEHDWIDGNILRTQQTGMDAQPIFRNKACEAEPIARMGKL